MNPYGAPVLPAVGHASLYGGTTPFSQTSPQQAATIQPGAITYTTTTRSDGQVVYHPFKCVRLPCAPDCLIGRPNHHPRPPEQSSRGAFPLLAFPRAPILTSPARDSYQTAQGVVNGIQWIPVEATSILPANATPADSVRGLFVRIRHMQSG